MEACTKVTKEWLNSMEYRELNFAREKLVINPAKACQPLGALLCSLGIEGCLPFVHGSQGCAAYFRSTLSRHFREPVAAVSDSMTEDSAVFGGQSNFIEGLRNAYAVYKPKVISVFTSCMAEVIGDDIKSYLGNAKEQDAIPRDLAVALANTPSFKGSHITGYDSTVKSLIECLAKPRQEDTINDRLYVVPGFDTYPANLREYKRLLKEMNAPFTLLPDHSDVLDAPNLGTYELYPGGTPISEMNEALNAKSYLMLQAYSTSTTSKYLKGKGVPVETIPMPIGLSGTDNFIQAIAKFTGKEVPEEITIERGRAVDAMTDCHQYIHGKKFALFGDPDILIGLVSFLLEMGGEPVHIVCTNSTVPFKKAMEKLLSSSPYGQGATLYPGKDLWHLRSLLVTEPVDMLIGDGHGKYAARDANIPLIRVGIPIYDRVNLHRYPIVGYSGVINLITMIVNTFLDEIDRASTDTYFELMR
ncbi:nitrogenase molybdenum-iron protein beta chain [Desulfosporosinus orientis DSM 765]|uniref:Nitrogenase molybdenum-iron protein beta chain n=1 Tax=Desulfosporosinus orientis (strain ATCC 19365 / DSM 765 / NCIMB 8382 / VKM B-1628 / Singapore I) TaxID=768706 RepID=G7WJH9_DESOD|nr:nitrogenase molybdenum-iron protein subunit beta [Desulfosporosinus orientis]AET70416.1 nitrogenase molybdenum-iron protein beta chain [Desulfosporosinus orientis DSM 765]